VLCASLRVCSACLRQRMPGRSKGIGESSPHSSHRFGDAIHSASVFCPRAVMRRHIVFVRDHPAYDDTKRDETYARFTLPVRLSQRSSFFVVTVCATDISRRCVHRDSRYYVTLNDTRQPRVAIETCLFVQSLIIHGTHICCCRCC